MGIRPTRQPPAFLFRPFGPPSPREKVFAYLLLPATRYQPGWLQAYFTPKDGLWQEKKGLDSWKSFWYNNRII